MIPVGHEEMSEYCIEASSREMLFGVASDGHGFSFPRVAGEESARPRPHSERVMKANSIHCLKEGTAFFVVCAQGCLQAIERPRRRPVTTLDNFYFVTQGDDCSVQTVHEYAVTWRVTPWVRVANS